MFPHLYFGFFVFQNYITVKERKKELDILLLDALNNTVCLAVDQAEAEAEEM